MSGLKGLFIEQAFFIFTNMEFKEKPKKLGVVRRTHGVHGGLVVESAGRFANEVQIPEWSFIQLDGGLVPFRLIAEECFIKDDHQLVVFLEGLSSPEAAQDLMQKEIFFPDSFWSGSFSLEAKLATLTGYAVVFKGTALIGEMKELVEIPGNPVLSIELENREVLVPAIEEFILEIDDNSRKILLEVPDGLLDLN